jgi:S1-C subfamily serine protease
MKPALIAIAIASAMAFTPFTAANAQFSATTTETPVSEVRLPDFTKLVEENGKGVVNISTIKNARTETVNMFPGMEKEAEIFKRFGFPFPLGPQQQRIPEQRGTGSGFIISSDGLILTNAHVVEGADELRIRLTDNREFMGKVLGLDKKTDIVRINDVEGEINPLAMTIDLADGSSKQITIEQPEVRPINAIMTELESFNNAIVNNTEPPVTIHDGVQALKVCYMILDEIVKHQEIVRNYLK